MMSLTKTQHSFRYLIFLLLVSTFIPVNTATADNIIMNPASLQVKDEGGFTMHGNWCGPNHPKDVKNADDPIDILDKQCKTHDLCYIKKGQYDCSCDRAMVLDIDKTQHRDAYTTQQYLIAQNIKIHFSLSPCNGDVANNKILPTRILTNIYNKTKNRALDMYDRFNR